ncbi:hypothetical protein PV325_008461, partial [Microctonus aethiopoides]
MVVHRNSSSSGGGGGGGIVAMVLEKGGEGTENERVDRVSAAQRVKERQAAGRGNNRDT